MSRRYYALWHMRFDDADQDYDKHLGVYWTQEKAEQGLAQLRDKPGFRDRPDGFEINEGRMNATSMREGFITLVGDEELETPQNVYTSITQRASKDVPIWARGKEPGAGENGGDFALRLMDEHHGSGKWSLDNPEFDQLRRYGNRGNLDPRANVASRSVYGRPPCGPEEIYYSLWHRRTDEYDYDHDMQLGTYSSREQAEEGISLLRDQLGFRDYPHSFEITWGRIDETYETEGFVTVPPEEVPASRTRS